MRMRIGILGVVGVLVSNQPSARADVCKLSGRWNVMAGPVIGIQLSGKSGAVIGLEGGVGCSVQRLNLGFEYRAGVGFGYVELDPWLLLGASLGIGVDTDRDVHPVAGLWEGIPMSIGGDCGGTEHETITTISLGYRYTGVHEIYFSVKAGTTRPLDCNKE